MIHELPVLSGLQHPLPCVLTQQAGCINSCRASRLLARLVIDETVSPAHVLLSPPALRQLGLQPHRRLAVTLKAAQQPGSAPLSVVLHPVRALRPGVHRLVSAKVDLQGLAAPDLRGFFASWLACQAAAGAHSPGCSSPEAAQSASMPQEAGPEHGSRAAQVQRNAEGKGSSQSSCDYIAVPVQSGSILSVQSADGERTSSFFIELSWQAGEPKESQFLLQSAAAFLESSTPVQLGPALELPAVAQQDKSAWPEQTRQSSSSTSSTQAAASPPCLSGTHLLFICHDNHIVLLSLILTTEPVIAGYTTSHKEYSDICSLCVECMKRLAAGSSCCLGSSVC